MNTEDSEKAVSATDGQEQHGLASIPGEEIGRVMGSYTNRIRSLHTAVEFSVNALRDFRKKKTTHYEQYEKKYGLQGSDGEPKMPSLHLEDHLKTMRELFSAVTHTLDAEKLVPRSLFVSMMSEYESYLGRLLTTMFNLKPDMCSQFKKPLDVQQALKFQSIEAMRAYIIGTEVDGAMWGDTAERLGYFANTLHAIDVDACDGVAEVCEISLRRNLYVHCDGVVGQPYIRKCAALHAKMPKDCCEGKVLEITPGYFYKAGELLLTLGLEIGASLWWNGFRESREKTADYFNRRVMNDLLHEDDNVVAFHVGEYALRRFEKDTGDVNRRIFVINTAQAYKWNKDEANCKRILGMVDWGATADRFEFQVAVLQDEYGQAAKYMVKMGRHGDIHDVEYHDWPLLKEFRKTKEFQGAYKKVFNRPYNDFSSETKPAAMLDANASRSPSLKKPQLVPPSSEHTQSEDTPQ